jgi:hypothetical protein
MPKISIVIFLLDIVTSSILGADMNLSLLGLGSGTE